jgi:hypothetical protein
MFDVCSFRLAKWLNMARHKKVEWFQLIMIFSPCVQAH